MLSVESDTALVEIVAVLRPESTNRTIQALEQLEQLAFTRWRALGRGRQGGLCVDGQPECAPTIAWLPKAVLSVVVPADHADSVVAAIIKANRSGSVGDGRVFVCPIDEDISVRTGGRCAALVEA